MLVLLRYGHVERAPNAMRASAEFQIGGVVIARRRSTAGAER